MIAEMDRLTHRDYATALGVTIATVKGYRARGCNATTIEEMRRWRNENVRTNGPPTLAERAAGVSRGNADLDEEEQLEKIEKIREERRKLKLANDEREGSLLDSEDVELQVTELTGMIRARLEAIAGELEPEWPPEVRALVTERMKDKVNLILTEMSQWRLGAGE